MTKYSKGGTVHRKKSSAQKVATACRQTGVRYHIVKVKQGYRVDKKY